MALVSVSGCPSRCTAWYWQVPLEALVGELEGACRCARVALPSVLEGTNMCTRRH